MRRSFECPASHDRRPTTRSISQRLTLSHILQVRSRWCFARNMWHSSRGIHRNLQALITTETGIQLPISPQHCGPVLVKPNPSSEPTPVANPSFSSPCCGTAAARCVQDLVRQLCAAVLCTSVAKHSCMQSSNAILNIPPAAVLGSRRDISTPRSRQCTDLGESTEAPIGRMVVQPYPRTVT